jgi:AraC-like DNA-binding protein
MQTARRFAPTASIRLLWPFLEVARAHGHDVSKVGERLGLTDAELRHPDTRVPQQRLADLLNEAIAASGVRDLGLLAAEYADATHFGIGEFIARSGGTLRDALESTVRYLPLLGDGARCELEIDGKVARSRFWLDPRLEVHEAAYEFLIAIGLLRARRITGMPALAPIEVNFMHERPRNTARHEKLFACPIRFGAGVTQIVMLAKFLDMRMAGAEPALNQLLSREADRQLASLPRARRTRDQVEADLAARVELRSASAERVARKLGMSARTLHRKLTLEGTSYREIFDRVRAAAAVSRLQHGNQPIAEIAHALGFASPQSFHRAFKRWTGTTAARQRALARRRKPRRR